MLYRMGWGKETGLKEGAALDFIKFAFSFQSLNFYFMFCITWHLDSLSLFLSVPLFPRLQKSVVY